MSAGSHPKNRLFINSTSRIINVSVPLLRISHLVSGDVWGGLEAMVLDLLTSEVYQSCTETTLILLNEGRLATRARDKGLKVVVVSESTRSFYELVRELRGVIAGFEPDIIHTHRYKEILIGALLSQPYARRHIVTIHGYEPPVKFLVRSRTFISNYLCMGIALVRGGHFVVVADHLRKCYNIPLSRCISIRNGIKISESAVQPKQNDYSVEPVIGWVGRMVPVKGLPTLLFAIAEMSSAPAPHLLLIGEGPERASLEALAHKLGIFERVHFQGFVENTWPTYKQMDVFVLPSLHEGTPLALLEAMGSGLPVVASSVGGIPLIMGSSGAGVLIDSRSPSIWAKAIDELLSDRVRMNSIGERARRHIQDNFSLEEMARQYLSLYKAVRASH